MTEKIEEPKVVATEELTVSFTSEKQEDVTNEENIDEEIEAEVDNKSSNSGESADNDSEIKDSTDDPHPASESNNRTMSVRKGKWTAEEEKYTNKIIEVFNAGLLKLDEEDRGITLRAYLAKKLKCDPMRITKKYTGSSCLGKRVYHFDFQQVDKREADRLRDEIDFLERAFKLKLEQINRKKSNEPAGYDESYRISTPAIDALLERSKLLPAQPQPTMARQVLPPFAGYPPHLFANSPANLIPAHPHYFPMPPQMVDIGEVENGRLPTVIPTVISPGDNVLNNFSIPPHQLMPHFLRGPNGELFVHPSYASAIPQYFVAMPSYVAMKDRMPAYPLPFSPYPMPPTSGINMPGGPTWKDIHAAASLNPVPPVPPVGMTLPTPAFPIPIVDVSALEPKSKRPRVNHEISPHEIKDKSVGNAVDYPGKSEAFEDELLNRRIELSEVDQNDAATSLLGFINHVKKNSSQEDLAEFFEGVHQKSAGGVKSPNINSTWTSPTIPNIASFGFDLYKLDKNGSNSKFSEA